MIREGEREQLVVEELSKLRTRFLVEEPVVQECLQREAHTGSF